MMFGLIFAVFLALSASAGSAQGTGLRPPLSEVEPVLNGLVTAAMVVGLDEGCGSIRLRRLRGIGFLLSLRAEAQNRGYTPAEIESYLDDPNEKAAIRALAEQELGARGVRLDEPESFCQVARAEIGADTRVGRLLQ